MKKLSQLFLLLLTASCAYAVVPGCEESLAKAKKDLKVAGSNQEADLKPSRTFTKEKGSLKNIAWYLGTGGVSVLALGVAYQVFRHVQQQGFVSGAPKSTKQSNGRSEGCRCGETCACGDNCQC